MKIHFYKKDLKDVIGRVEDYQPRDVMEKCYLFVLLNILRYIGKTNQKDFLPDVIQLSNQHVSDLKSNISFAYNINFTDNQYWVHIKLFE